jgi:hypothetical protein
VRIDTTYELEAPVQRLEDGPVELPYLLPEVTEVVHQGSFSDFSSASVRSLRLNPGAHTESRRFSNANDADAAR